MEGEGGHCETHKRLHVKQFDKEKSEYDEESDVPIKGKKIEDKPKKTVTSMYGKVYTVKE